MAAKLKIAMETNPTMPAVRAERWVTKQQLAAHLQCCPRTVNNLMRRRILPYRKIGRLLRFDPAECDRALEAFQVRSLAGRPF